MRPFTILQRSFLGLVCLLQMAMLAHANDTLRVFIFAGQSNMVGADAHAKDIDSFPTFVGAGTPQDDVLYSYILGNGEHASKGWESLHPLESFGPEITFARKVKQQTPGPIAIIKSAVGGTTIAADWNPDAPENGQKLYPRTLQRIRESLNDLDRRGIHYRLEGVIWHQGENDMLDRKLYKQYAQGLTRCIASLRKDLNAPELKWYLAEVSEKGIWGMDHRSNLEVLYQQQQQVLESDPLTRWVPTSYLAFEIMDHGQPHYHFGTLGQLQLGEAFAEAYLKDVKVPSAKPTRRFLSELPVAANGIVHVFVLAGQRNMEGEGAYDLQIAKTSGFEHLAPDQSKICFRYSLGGGVTKSVDWEPLGPTGFLGNFGPELSLSAKLRASLPREDGIAIVKFTDSGAQGPDWSPTESPETHRNLFSKFVAFVRDAQEDLQRRGYTCNLDGIFWCTGENDTYFAHYADNNAKLMLQLIEQSRKELKEPHLKWFISDQHPGFSWPKIETVNNGLTEIASHDPDVFVIHTSHLQHARFHFGTEGTLQLGHQFATEYLRHR